MTSRSNRSRPPVELRPTTEPERATALTAGTNALADLVDAEEHKLRALRDMLRLARLVADGEATLDDSDASQRWERGLEILEDHYSESSWGTAKMDEIGAVAAQAAVQLGLVSGHWVFARGGSGPDYFCMQPRCTVEADRQEHGGSMQPHA
jgi:hypothetical protein